MDMILRRATIAGAEESGPRDIGIKDGRIAAIEPALESNARSIDVAGKLVSPGFVESHIHLDKSFIRDRSELVEGTIQEAFDDVIRQKTIEFSPEDVHARAERTLRKCLLNGTTHMRTQLEVDPFVGLRSLEGILPLIEAYKWAIDIEICVFPEEGLFNRPGTEDLMIEALKRGCRVIGANPSADSDPTGQIDWVFDTAREFDVDIDMHLDADENPADMLSGYVCELTEKFGYGGRVTLAHLIKATAVPEDRFNEIARRLAGAGVAVTVLPITDLYISGRDMDHNVLRGVLPAHKMLRQGVNCAMSTNNVVNPITPFGHCSLLHLATVYANICHVWRPEDLAECFEMVTRRAAKNLRRDDYGIEVGNPADLVVLDCADRVEAVCQPAAPLYGFKRGHMVFEREPVSLQGPS
jgi:cytosine deaminase